MLVPGSKISDFIFAAKGKIEYDLNNKNLAQHLDGISIGFTIGHLDIDSVSIGYSRKHNYIRVSLSIPYYKTAEMIEKEGEEAALMYIYNRLLKGINKIDLTCKRWTNPSSRKRNKNKED